MIPSVILPIILPVIPPSVLREIARNRAHQDARKARLTRITAAILPEGKQTHPRARENAEQGNPPSLARVDIRRSARGAGRRCADICRFGSPIATDSRWHGWTFAGLPADRHGLPVFPPDLPTCRDIDSIVITIGNKHESSQDSTRDQEAQPVR
jgi:hypothetical protein